LRRASLASSSIIAEKLRETAADAFARLMGGVSFDFVFAISPANW
jgi:hypothetical protein